MKAFLSLRKIILCAELSSVIVDSMLWMVKYLVMRFLQNFRFWIEFVVYLVLWYVADHTFGEDFNIYWSVGLLGTVLAISHLLFPNKED